MKKKITICVVAGILLSVAVLLAIIARPVKQTMGSKSIWHNFQKAIANSDWKTVEALLHDSENDLHQIENGKILYAGADYTMKLKNEDVRFLKTLEFYLTDKSRRYYDKIVLDHGYARIENEIITFLKFP